MRNQVVSHEEWLKERATPLLRLDSSRPVDDLVEQVLGHAAVIKKRPQA